MPCTCPWLHHAHARGIAMHRCMERPRAWAWYSHAQSFGETPPSLSLIRYSWTALKSDIFYMIHPCHLIIMSQGHMTSLNALHCNGLLFRKLLASQLWCKVNGTLLSRGKQINAGAWLGVFCLEILPRDSDERKAKKILERDFPLFFSFNLIHNHQTNRHEHSRFGTVREGCTKQKPEKVWSFAKPGGVLEGSKMPNLYFGVLKRVKNGLKMAKKHIEILYFS